MTKKVNPETAAGPPALAGAREPEHGNRDMAAVLRRKAERLATPPMRVPGRVLTEEVGGLPVGTHWESYRVEAAPFGSPGAPVAHERAAWVGRDGLRRGGRIGGSSKTAHALFAAHLAALGVNPNDTAPCSACGEEILAVLTLCPECGADPEGPVECYRCEGVGEVTVGARLGGPWNETSAVCPGCEGTRTMEGIYTGAREAALRQARAWKRSQSAEQNPAPAGIGGDR